MFLCHCSFSVDLHRANAGLAVGQRGATVEWDPVSMGPDIAK
jgi:hypothetical protein